MRSTTKGKIAEHIFISEFMKQGYQVFQPIDEWGKIDLIVLKNGIFQRIQVKSRKPRNGSLQLRNRSSTTNYRTDYDGAIDLFALYDAENGKGYLVPIGDFEEYISLRIVPSRNNQSIGITRAETYSFF